MKVQSWCALLIVAVVLSLAMVVSPARADHCVPQVVEVPGGLEVVYPCGEQSTGPADGHEGMSPDPAGGSGQVTCNEIGWPSDGGPPIPYRETEKREGDSTWGLANFYCSDGSERSWWECVSTCSAAPDTDWPGRLNATVSRAVSRVDPPLPGMRHTFDHPAADGRTRTVVLAETWWWAEGPLDPIVVYDEDGPVWAEVTATSGPMTIDPGDGTVTFECPGPGLAYDPNQSYYDQIPGEPRGACVHVYEHTFEEVTATMTITWELAYEGFAPGLGTVSGTLTPVVRTQEATFPVRELQSVIVH